MPNEGFDLFEKLAETPTGAALLEQYQERWAASAPRARQCTWAAEDGYLVTYTTSRVEGGEHDGKFLVQVHKPVGKGARSGKAMRFSETYRRAFSTRKAAKARAEKIYRQHSPEYDARWPL